MPPTWRPRRLTGQVLQNAYRVERCIGTGSMGSVYEVVHIRFGRHFAAKVLSPTVTSSPRALARFRQEALVTSSLGNPHILQVFDFNTMEDDTPYIIMELLRGEDLGERLDSVQRMPLHQVTHIFHQAASALEAAHAKGVIHRDLKPSNIFLCQQEEGQQDYVKIVDFGISKVLGAREAVTGTHELLGSPAFMSPEQAMIKASKVDHTSDIFTMGSILYMMLTGQPPFLAESVPAMLYNVVHEEPAPPSSICADVPAAVEAVLSRAMAKDRTRRHVSMQDFWLEFARAAEVGDAVITAPVAPVAPASPVPDAKANAWMEVATLIKPRNMEQDIRSTLEDDLAPSPRGMPFDTRITQEDLPPQQIEHHSVPQNQQTPPPLHLQQTFQDQQMGLHEAPTVLHHQLDSEAMPMPQPQDHPPADSILSPGATGLQAVPTANVRTSIPPPPAISSPSSRLHAGAC